MSKSFFTSATSSLSEEAPESFSIFLFFRKEVSKALSQFFFSGEILVAQFFAEEEAFFSKVTVGDKDSIKNWKKPDQHLLQDEEASNLSFD
nr:hypothetical protein Iba_chr06dCG6420 [Ipomoea batatas]